MNKVVTYKLRKNDDTKLYLRLEITYDALMKMKKEPFWKKSKNTNLQELSWSDYCKNMSKEYNSYALSESNLAKMEDLCREFIDENGKQVGHNYTSLFSDSHTINGTSTYSNLASGDGLQLYTGTNSVYKYKIGTDYGYSNDTSAYIYYYPTTTTHMPKFKVGDKIKYINKQTSKTYGSWTLEKDEEFEILANNHCTSTAESYYKVRCIKCQEGFTRSDDIWVLTNTIENSNLFELISSPQHSMSALSKLRDAMRGEPDKKFRKSGLQGSDGEFTDDARSIFLESMMKEDAKKEDGVLQKAADAIIEAQEEEKKCCK